MIIFLSFQRSSNAAQSLCDVIRLSRDHMSQLQENADQDPLLDAVQRFDFKTENGMMNFFHNIITNRKK